MLREKFKWRTHENESTDARHRDGLSSSSVEGPVMGLERRGFWDREISGERLAGAV
jgi:hypothetical protein